MTDVTSGRVGTPVTETIGWRELLAAAVLGVLATTVPLAAVAAVALPAGLLVVRRPRLLVAGLALFMPFEEFLLKLLPVSDVVFSASRFLSEATIYTAFLVLLGHCMVRRIPLQRTPVDLPLVLLLGAVALSLVVNRSPVVGSIANVRPMLRYIVLFYIVVNIRLTETQIRVLVGVVLATAGIQIGLGFLQKLGGPTVSSFFLPRLSSLEIEGQQAGNMLLESGRELGSVFGAMGDTVIYGVFLVAGLVVYLARRPVLRRPDLVIVGCFLMAIAWSYSRAAVFAAIGGLLVWYRIRVGWRRAITVGSGALLTAVAGMMALVSIPADYVNPRFVEESALGNLVGVFSLRYVEVAQKQRLGALVGNVPTVLLNRPLLGYGPDQQTAIDRLNASQRSFLLKVWSKEGFKDVYWVAVLTFYGLAGLAAFAGIFWRLYRSAWRSCRQGQLAIERQLGAAVICLIAVTSFLLFFSRTLEFRPYGFAFWLMAGLMLAAQAIGRDQPKEVNAS